MSSEKWESSANGRCNDKPCASKQADIPVSGKRSLLPSYPKQIQLPGLTLTDVFHPPFTEIPPHDHSSASICLTLAGESVEINGKVRENVRPGSLILRAAGLVHSDHFGVTGHRGFMIEIEAKWFETCRLFSRVFEGHKHFQGGLVSSLAFRIYRESRIKDSVAPIVVEGLMLELLGNATRSLAKPAVRLPEWLSRARDLLHGQFNDSLNLIQIADTVGVHPTHLARTFKKHYRTTVGEYIRQLRLDWAMKQLLQTDDAIADIASAAGFYDQSHFNHSFKQRTGLTPAEFRLSSRCID